ncbi:hypothetical protein LZ519_07490 [Sphingomonas sp. RG327]|uniref:Uncharacterized protein n=1 Tax=Sphingomonas anseongensis TaxID=2908207 RepID=A0ABT0RFV4_9SPHN|nr:hypothetical protein [Sphingomonas anseongensis]MCL6679157.1 hypothetical protein [Sphingomonas anseongensis]
MNIRRLWTGLIALCASSGAIAGTCNIESSAPPGQWKFVKVYDVHNGEIVLQRGISGGRRYEVTAKGDRIRIDWKFAGGTHYNSGAVVTCKDGHIVKS